MRHWIFAFFVIFFCSSIGHAQYKSFSGGSRVYFEETFFPVYLNKNDAVSAAGGSRDTEVPTEKGLGMDSRTTLGYFFHFNMFVGMTYNYYSVRTHRPLTADWESIDTYTKKNEFGPTLGYQLFGWRLMATYFTYASKYYSQRYILPDETISNDDIYRNRKGKGFQVAVGYDFQLGGGISISPTLVYRAIRYERQSRLDSVSVNSYEETSLKTRAVDKDLKPMITISFSL